MRTYNIKWIFCFTLVVLVSCQTRTYDEISEVSVAPATVNYNQHIKPIIQASCVVCHTSGGSASYFPLTNYTETKAAVSEILDRIQKPSGDPEKMPVGGSLSTNDITLIKKWQADGLLEQ